MTNLNYYLNVSPVCRHKLFIYVRASFPDTTLRGINTTSAANLQQIKYPQYHIRILSRLFMYVVLCVCGWLSHLAEEPLAAPSGRRRVIDIDIMVLSAHWLLHKRFLENFSINLHMVLSLNQVRFCHRTDKHHISRRYHSNAFPQTYLHFNEAI